MPGIPAQYDPNDKATNAAGDAERVARLKYIDDRWNYYDGNQFLWLKKDPGATRDDNITLNLCGRSVDKTVEFVGKPDDFNIPGQEDIEQQTKASGGVHEVTESDPQARLELVYERYECEVPEIVQNGLISGHTFLKLHYDADNNPAMTLLDSRYVTVFWDHMNYKRVLFYRLQWSHGDTHYRQDIVPDWMFMPPPDDMSIPVAENWIIIDFKQQKNGNWITDRQQIWEYPFAPIVDWPQKRRPHQYYGVSFLHNSIQLNDAVNFVASNTARIIKHHAHPKTFAFGFEVSDENAVGGVWDGLPSPDEADIKTLELQSDLTSSMNFLSMLKGEFFANQRVLDQSNIKDKIGALTNFGVRMLFSDQLEMTDEVRTSVGGGLAKAFKCLLAMSGIVLDKEPEPEWEDPLPVNRLEVLQAAKIEKDLGTTSNTTLTESIDRDPEKEQQLKAEEGANATDVLTNTLTRIGDRGLFGVGMPSNRPQQPMTMNGSANRLPMAS